MQQDNDFTFPPKVLFQNIILAGLLTFPIFSGLPILTDSGVYGVTEKSMHRMHQDHSYGDSSGFIPDSLLMKLLLE